MNCDLFPGGFAFGKYIGTALGIDKNTVTVTRPPLLLESVRS